MPLINNLIPKKFTNIPKLYRSVYSIVMVDLSILLLSLVFIPIFFIVDFHYGAYIMMYSALASIVYLGILRVTENLDLCANYFTIQSLIVTLSLMYFTGGITSPYIFWLFCICPVSFIFFKERYAIFWSSVTTFCFIAFAVLQIFGFSVEQHLNSQLSYILMAINFCFSLFIFISTVRGFQGGFKKINSKLKESNLRLKDSNTELERFAYIASHDLKSPLRSIVSFVNLFNRKYKHQIDDTGKEFLQIISTNAEQMNHLIEDILEYSQSSQREAKKEDVDMNKIMEQVVINVLSESEYTDAQIQFSSLPTIISDLTLVKQLFQNLIENGLKYNESKHKVVSVQYLEKENEHYFLIKDNGIGMEKEYFDQIFEMFKRLHNQSNYQGTGIGLAICKKIILQLEGKIWVSSKVGAGSIFHISLPKKFHEPRNTTKEVGFESLVNTN